MLLALATAASAQGTCTLQALGCFASTSDVVRYNAGTMVNGTWEMCARSCMAAGFTMAGPPKKKKTKKTKKETEEMETVGSGERKRAHGMSLYFHCAGIKDGDGCFCDGLFS